MSNFSFWLNIVLINWFNHFDKHLILLQFPLDLILLIISTDIKSFLLWLSVIESIFSGEVLQILNVKILLSIFLNNYP